MTALDRQQAVFDAILSKLLGDAQLTALVGNRIFAAPTPNGPTPELTIRHLDSRDDSTSDTDGQILAFEIDVWDRYRAGQDLSGPRTIMNHIRRVLHRQPMTAAGCNIVVVSCTGSQGPFRDEDNISLHGILQVQIIAGHE